MGRTIVISQTEKHPLPPGVARPGEEKSAVVFFGLHNDRGENVVYSTRVTDKLFDVLSKYDLVSYRGDQEFRARITGYREFIRPDVTVDMVGIAYHIRKLWNAEKYFKFICEITDAIGDDQSKDARPIDVPVKPKSETPPPPALDNPTA